MKGIFKIITNILNGILVNLEIMMETPVIPPSKIVLGIKKHSKAKAAIIVPKVIKNMLSTFTCVLFCFVTHATSIIIIYNIIYLFKKKEF